MIISVHLARQQGKLMLTLLLVLLALMNNIRSSYELTKSITISSDINAAQQQQQQQQKALLATIIDESMNDDISDDDPTASASIEEESLKVAFTAVEDEEQRASLLHRRSATTATEAESDMIGNDFENLSLSSRQFRDESEKLRAIDQTKMPITSSTATIATTTTMVSDEYEISVSDQFVTVDNDALFRCQLPGQWRDLYQLVAWLEDGQLLPELSQLLLQQQPLIRTLVLPDGQLYVQRVQLRDANKSYRCQVRNVLTGQLSMSPLSGRLFVTDADEQQGGIQPRIVDSPQAITLAKLNEQILLSCLAQGSPRPNMRWFKQLANNKDWIELLPSSSSLSNEQHLSLLNNSSDMLKTTQQQQQKYSILADGNLLLIKSPQQTDNRAKFRCLANNTYGMHHMDTELRLELYPQSKLVEIEPKIEYINNGDSEQRSSNQLHNERKGEQSARSSSSSSSSARGHIKAAFNCTIRASNLPLVAIEWLKNGKLLASISLPQYSQLAVATAASGSFMMPKSPISFQPTSINNNGSSQSIAAAAASSQIVSMFDDLNQELTLIEQFSTIDEGGSRSSSANILMDDGILLNQESSTLYQNGGIENLIIKPTSLAKLEQLEEASDESSSSLMDQQRQQQPQQHQRTSSSAHRISQRVRFVSAKDRTILLYQLRFNQLRRLDRGSYQCRARTTRGSLHATGQLLLKDTPPVFIETFPNQLINTESIQSPQASLKCIASGSPLPEISWRLSGFQIPESSRYRVGDYVTRDGLIVSFVNITNVQAEDGGLYECSATNDVSQLRHSGWLNVTGGPYVRPMPNMSAIAGGSMSIMCPVGGWPIDQISWFQNSSKLPVNHRQKLFPNGTLLISDLDEVTDSGQYSCQAKWSANADLFASNSLHVSIKVPPVVEPLSFAKSLHRGQRYNIMCTVVRGDLPVNIRWFKDSRLLSQQIYSQTQDVAIIQQPLEQLQHQPENKNNNNNNNNNNNIVIKQLDPYSSTLTFASLQPNHRGLYTCEATNEAGRANQSSQLVIHVPPSWRIEPKDLSVTVDKTAVIDCQADAFPAARIEWRLSQDLYREPPTEFKPIISSLYMRVFENGSLIIYNTQKTDAGYYLCQASNGVGPGLSRVVKLTVHVAAHFKSKIRTELVRRNQMAKLKCESIGDPPIEINWLKDKMPLYVGDGGPPRYTLTRTPLQDGLSSELQISDTDRQDSALFTCISQNQFGNDDTNIQLIVQSAPDPPLDIRIHEYEARSVKISWLPGHSGNLPILKYIIQYAQISAPSSGLLNNENTLMLLDSSNLVQQQQQTRSLQLQMPLQYLNVSVSGNETNLVLSNLSPLTEYQFFMYAVNAIGSARAPTNNEPIRFRTDDEAPSGPPLYVKAQPLSSHSIKIRWRPPERRGLHYGSISGYYVGYKLLKQSQTSSNHAVSGSSSSSSSDTFVYKTVELPQGGSISSSETILANRSLVNLKQQLQQEHECLLSGLRRAQKYLINIQAFNGRGAGPASEAIVAETWRIDVPDPPIMRMLLRTTHSIHLMWRLVAAAAATSNQAVSQQLSTTLPDQQRISISSQAAAAATTTTTVTTTNNQQVRRAGIPLSPELDLEREAEIAQANEPILGFILSRRQLSSGGSSIGSNDRQQQTNDAQQQPAVEMRLPSDHMSQIVDNLTCGTRYQFTIVALNSVGPSEPSEPLTIKTEGSTPVAPDKSSLLMTNSSSVMINLAAWHNGQCAMKSFELMFKPSRSKKWTPINVMQQQDQLQQHFDTFTDSNNQQLVQRSAALASTQQQQQPQLSSLLSGNNTIILEDLSSALNYDLRILATNEAGSTEALYTFNTNNNAALSRSQLDSNGGSNGGEFHLVDASLSSLFSSTNTIVPWLVFFLFLALTLTTGCILFARRRHFTSSACSLSLSSASRSNQSSSNYYTSSAATTTATTTTTTPAATNLAQQQQQQQQSQMIKMNGGANTLQKLHLINDTHDDDGPMGSHIHLGDVYGHHQLVDKSNYAFLSQQQQQQQQHQRSPSPQNTELGSVMNGGSEAEMCLGASAINIANQQQQQQQMNNSNNNNNDNVNNDNQQPATSCKPLQQQQQQQQTYYVTPMQLMLSNKQALAMSQMANKSSTLPSSNCHQQQYSQSSVGSHNQQQHQHQQQQQQLVDNLMAANLMQQQLATANNGDGGYITMDHHNHDSIGSTAADMAALLEQQLQQQVYATVKRGCPRPPRLCDYGIYQCPAANQTDHQMRCCAELANLHQPTATGSSVDHQNQQAQQVCYHMDPGNTCNVLQQQQQQPSQSQQHQLQATSDYQQLRPMN